MKSKYLEPWDALSLVLKELEKRAKPGVKTINLDKYAEKRIEELGFKSYIKGYKHPLANTPWEYVTCINVNNIIAHGYPSEYKLKSGDIVSFDIGIKRGNQCADGALSVGVGTITDRQKSLLKRAKLTVYEAIRYMKPGANTYDIARVIETYAITWGFLVNRRFAGHRIGKDMHMKPNIYNSAEDAHTYDVLKPGQIYCVEPMLTNGRDNLGICVDPNGWEYRTMDGKDSAFFEHMVRITKTGSEILTTHFNHD